MGFQIGVNGFLVRNNQLLLGQRKNCFGAGDWGLPGGHLEFGESLEQAVTRELLEETGLSINEWTFSNLVNYPNEKDHYLQIGFIAKDFIGEPQIMEPEKCFAWRWFDLDALPENIFAPHQKQVQAFVDGDVAFVDSK